MQYTFIFDVGKTNLKSYVFDETGNAVIKDQSAHPEPLEAGFTAIDIDAIDVYLRSSLERAAKEYEIGAINISTHGACAVLLDADEQLLFPVVDYEFDGYGSHNAAYDSARPEYSRTFSPKLSAGLNLGRQLWWLRATRPTRFAELQSLLFLPQYFVWRLTGKKVVETTSLGCHTDMWEPKAQCFSSMAKHLGLQQCIPRQVSPTEPVGTLLKEVAVELGLPSNCIVYPGVHDSNASLARYLTGDIKAPFTVVSTGTWTVTMAVGGTVDVLRESKDMLCNVSVLGDVVPCARFMGGREFEEICRLLPPDSADEVTISQLQTLIDGGDFALPPFQPDSGPFSRSIRSERFIGGMQYQSALATMYLALMIDFELTLLRVTGPIVLGGISERNPLLCRLLAQLRPDQPVMASNDESSTALGAWALTCWDSVQAKARITLELVAPVELNNLHEYRDRWRKLADQGDVDA